MRPNCAPLLIALFVSASAAAQSPEALYRDASAAAERRETASAALKAEAALKRFPQSDDDWVWALRVLHGDMLHAQRSPKEAGLWLDGLRLPPRLARSETAVRYLISRASVHARIDGDNPARTMFEKARALAAAEHPHMLADVHGRMAALGIDKERNAQTALALAVKYRKPFAELGALNDLAQGSFSVGRWAEGIHLIERGLAIARKNGYYSWAQKLDGNLAWAYRELGDSDVAAEILVGAERDAARAGQHRDRVPWLMQLGNTSLDRRDYVGASKYYSQALDLARRFDHVESAAIAGNHARVAILQKDFDAARRYSAEAREIRTRRKDLGGLLWSNLIDARLALATGRHAEAEAALEKLVAAARLSRKTGDQKTMMWEAEALLAEVFLAVGDGVRAERQFRRAIETVRAAREDITDAKLRFAFYRVAEDVFDAYIDFLVANKRDAAALDVTELIRTQTLQEGLGLASSTKKIDPSALARERNATILCYWLGHARSYVWIVTPKGVTLKPLRPEREIEAAIDQYQRLLMNLGVRVEQLRGRGEQLYQMLVAPAAAAIGRGSRVIIVPDGRMHALNMESLIVPGLQNVRFWIQDVILVNAGSVQLLGQSTPAPAANGAMLLVGDPPFADAAYPPLRNAKLEMQNVQRHFKQHVSLGGAQATPAAFQAAKPANFAYLHFVAHGEATRRKPLDAAVILGKDARGNYKLLARDVVEQRLAARLVTVSSCHGAGTRAFVGEGLVGLAWAFLRAGARQVVAALWQVDDEATPGLMNDMYAGIAAGKDPPTALRDAKLKLVANKGIYGKPFYWAPFVLYGGG